MTKKRDYYVVYEPSRRYGFLWLKKTEADVFLLSQRDEAEAVADCLKDGVVHALRLND